MQDLSQYTARQQQYIHEQYAIVSRRIGTKMDIRTSSGAMRSGVVEAIEFDHFGRTASGKSLFCIWKITQQIARADGNGTVARSLTIRL